LGGRLADAFLDAGEILFGDRAADDVLGELDPTARVGLEGDPHVGEHAVPAGLFLVAPVDLGLPADRLAVRDPRRARHDRRTELALEALADDRDVGLARADQELLARVAALDARRWLLVEHALERATQL